MYRVKEDPFKIRILYRGGFIHAMDVNRYYGTHLKSFHVIFYKLQIN